MGLARQGIGEEFFPRIVTVWLLCAAAMLGALFAGVKLTEYVHEYREHLVPVLDFSFDPRYARRARVFFSLYFAMTGLHLVHLAVGIGLVLTVAWTVHRNRRNIIAWIALLALLVITCASSFVPL